METIIILPIKKIDNNKRMVWHNQIDTTKQTEIYGQPFSHLIHIYWYQ